MIQKLYKTDGFIKWTKKLSKKAQRLVHSRLDMISIGHLGDHKQFEGIIEFRWKNGMRIYGFEWEDNLLLTNGGYKHEQKKDVEKTKKIKESVFNKTYTIYKL